ncbi:hypothetical protein [Tsukamurella sp. NPDC003166]
MNELPDICFDSKPHRFMLAEDGVYDCSVCGIDAVGEAVTRDGE